MQFCNDCCYLRCCCCITAAIPQIDGTAVLPFGSNLTVYESSGPEHALSTNVLFTLHSSQRAPFLGKPERVPFSVRGLTKQMAIVFRSAADMSTSAGTLFGAGITFLAVFETQPGRAPYCPPSQLVGSGSSASSLTLLPFFGGLECTWTVFSGNAEFAKVTFNSISIGVSDFVRVYDGTSASGPLLRSFSGVYSSPISVVALSRYRRTKNRIAAATLLYHCRIPLVLYSYMFVTVSTTTNGDGISGIAGCKLK
jgi:hypothetical protein